MSSFREKEQEAAKAVSGAVKRAEADVKALEAKAERLVQVIVAKGTLWLDKVRHPAGTTVALPAAEAERLKAAGFVADQAQAPAAPASSDGPSVTTSTS